MPQHKTDRASDPVAKPAAKLADGGVTAVARALQVMEAFRIGERQLPLAELSRRTALHNTTVLRLARTLAQSGFMVQSEDGQWRLGPAAGWLGARYQAGFDINNVVEPTLRDLSLATHESASFYVREGQERACISRVEGPQSVRHHVRIGMRLPLTLGAPGRVILAFSGEAGEVYEDIRRRGYHVSMGEREPVRQLLDSRGWFGPLAMQPGGPQGMADWHGTPVVCFPGNPVSVLVSFEVLLRNIIRQSAGLPPVVAGTARVSHDVTSIPGRTQFLRGRTDSGAVAVVGGPGSHLAVTAADADVLIEIDATTTRVNAGEEVRTWPLTN